MCFGYSSLFHNSILGIDDIGAFSSQISELKRTTYRPDIKTPEKHFPDFQNTMHHLEILNFRLYAITGRELGLFDLGREVDIFSLQKGEQPQ